MKKEKVFLLTGRITKVVSFYCFLSRDLDLRLVAKFEDGTCTNYPEIRAMLDNLLDLVRNPDSHGCLSYESYETEEDDATKLNHQHYNNLAFGSETRARLNTMINILLDLSQCIEDTKPMHAQTKAGRLLA